MVALIALPGAAAAKAWVGAPVSLPGITGPVVSVAGALRTNDGGAIVLAGIRRRVVSGAVSALTARVDADGTLALGYGYEGVARLRLGRGVIPAALAINPQTRDAWLGARNGQRSELFAIDGTGLRRAGFGDRGRVTLPSGDNGGVRALAWRRGELLVAAGDRAGCAGCALTMVSARSGKVIATASLTTRIAGPLCAGPVRVSSVALRQPTGVLVGTDVTETGQCSASVIALTDQLVPAGLPEPAPPLAAPRSVLVTSQPGPTCVARSGPAGTDIWPLGARRVTQVAGASAGLVTLVPLGGGACGALLRRAGRSAEVTQAAPGNPVPAVTNVPAGLAPLGMFRCHQHLLVIAARATRGRQAAVIVPVPIRPRRSATSAAVAVRGTGCQ